MKRSPIFALGAFSVIAITGIATAALSAESAQAPGGILKMNISANCEDGNAFFRIKTAKTGRRQAPSPSTTCVKRAES